MAARIQHTGVSADGKSCLIRKAIPDDTDNIRQLILSSSIHVTGLPKQQNVCPEAHAAPTEKKHRKPFRSLLLEIFASLSIGATICVAVSPKGRVIGCCQVKTLRYGIREIDTLCLDSNWRNGTVAMRLMRFVIANNPHPLWGTCMDNVVAFQKRNGGTVITDPSRMPAVLRRRWRLFNFLMRLAGRKERLNVMMLDTSQTTGKQTTDSSEHTPGNIPAAMRKALLQRIKKYQLKKSHPFRFPGLYETIQGLFVSYPTYTISLFKKYFGKSFHIRVPDNNAFATFWTLELLLEASA